MKKRCLIAAALVCGAASVSRAQLSDNAALNAIATNTADAAYFTQENGYTLSYIYDGMASVQSGVNDMAEKVTQLETLVTWLYWFNMLLLFWFVMTWAYGPLMDKMRGNKGLVIRNNANDYSPM